MRSFLVLLFISAFLPQNFAYAEASTTDFLSIELVKQENKSFNQLLTHAMKLELVRLSGNPEILKDPAVKPLITSPKSWLTSFDYSPLYSEGVVTGQKITFKFDKKRVYQQFQTSNLLVWPLHRRPKILVMGRYYLDTELTKMTKTFLDERPDINFLRYAHNVSLPLFLPKSSSEWSGMNGLLGLAEWQNKMNAGGFDYVLDLKTKWLENGQTMVTWILLNKTLKQVATHSVQGQERAMAYYERMINDLLRLTSATYRQNATVLGEMTLKVSGVDNYEELTALETFLNNQNPTFRHVKLLSISHDLAIFDIEYQGKLEFSIDLLQKNSHLTLTENNAVIGQLKAEWR